MKVNRLRAYLNNFFWLFLTYLLAPIFYFLIFLKRKKRTNERLKILVIQTAKIGDMVCTTPVFREIKKKFPSCYLGVLCLSKTKDILKNNPHINEIILITDYSRIGEKLRLIKKLRKEKYDWILNLAPSSFNNIISLQTYQETAFLKYHEFFVLYDERYCLQIHPIFIAEKGPK